MWERVQANPQLLFDVGLEIAASWQRLLAGVCVQQGQTCPGCKPAVISGGAWRVSIHSSFSAQSTRVGSHWGVLGDVCAHPCRSQPVPGATGAFP